MLHRIFGDTHTAAFPWLGLWPDLENIARGTRQAVWGDHTPNHNMMRSIWFQIYEELKEETENLIDN